MLASFVRRSSVVGILALTAMPALAQTTISGTVRDDRNAPLAGATISVHGSHAGATTNDAGRYRLVVPPEIRDRTDSLTLLARRIGFEAVTRQVAVSVASTDIDFVLKVSTLRLESVVVTGTAGVSERRERSSAKADRPASAVDAAGRSERDASSPAPLADRAASRADASRVGGRRGYANQEPRPGVLTAAAWDDAAHWPQYARFLRRAQQNSWNPWGLDVGQGTVRPVRNTQRPRSVRRALDVGFLVDATGSMGDEMTFLQSELKDIVRRVRALEPDLDIRVSVVFYRDRGDAFITKSLPFTRRVDEAVSFIAGTTADGGGDYPEDMNAGLEAMMRQGWSRDAVPQMLFLLADAPPQQYAGTDYTYHEAIADAAAKGIAIFPVAASGVDKPTEFLFRAMAVMTGGKYVFLTDDSGVGESHEEPDISGYTVEKLNDLMVREIRSYVSSRVAGQRVAEAR
jgi:Mg-chelatase subunit ChlD